MVLIRKGIGSSVFFWRSLLENLNARTKRPVSMQRARDKLPSGAQAESERIVETEPET